MEREIINHMRLRHPHIISSREVGAGGGCRGLLALQLAHERHVQRGGLARCIRSPADERLGVGVAALLWRRALAQPPKPTHTPLDPPPPPPPLQVFLTDKHLVVAMEYAPGGDLFNYIAARQRLDEEDARWFFQQLLIGLDYCHRMVRGWGGVGGGGLRGAGAD